MKVLSNERTNKGEENLKTNRQIEESLSFISQSPVYRQKMKEQQERKEQPAKKAVIKRKTVSSESTAVKKQNTPSVLHSDKADIKKNDEKINKKAENEKMRDEKPLPDFDYTSRSQRNARAETPSKHKKVSHERVSHEKVSHEKIPETEKSQPKVSKHERVVVTSPELKNEAGVQPQNREADISEKVRMIKNSISSGSESGSVNRNFASRDYAPSGNSEKTAVPQDSYSRFKRTAGTATAIKNRKEEIDEENLFEGEEPVSKKGNTAVREGVKDGVNKSNIITVVLVLILVIAIGILYTVGYMGFKGRYLKNTFVNGVNIGGVKIGEADELIASGAETSGITVVKGDGEEVHFDGNQFGCKYSVPAGTRYGEEKHKFWFTKLFHSTDYNIELDSSFEENALRALIQNYTWGTKDPVNARLEKGSDGKYEIVEGEKGDKLDNAKFAEYVISQVKEGNTKINVDDADCYLKAEITAEDLQSELDLINSTGSMTLTIDFNDSKEEIDSDTLSSWVSLDEKGGLVVDKDAVSEYVKTLSDKYNTYGKDRNFHSTDKGDIVVKWTPSSIYGWKINEETMTSKIVDAVKNLSTDTIKPSFSIFGYGDYSKDDIGKTYIELDISAQHFWLYKDGQCVLDDDVVTGLASDPERATPPGVYCVWDMVPGKYLGTYEVQGYHTWVDWWMNFTYLGIGFHDLNRSAYGGQIYKTNGSHGCVNLSKSTAEKLYNSIEVGIPVVAYE